VAAGASFTVGWVSYSCPSGTSLTGYSVEATNATVTQQPTTDASATLTAGTTVGPVEVKYNVSCSGSASGFSPALTLTVEDSTSDGNGNGNNGNGNGNDSE
jgi:serine/threonine-protein kinase